MTQQVTITAILTTRRGPCSVCGIETGYALEYQYDTCQVDHIVHRCAPHLSSQAEGIAAWLHGRG